MISFRVVCFYLGLSKKWSVAKVETTNDQIINDNKRLTSFGFNFHCDSIEIVC